MLCSANHSQADTAKTDGKYSTAKILECLNKIQCSHEDENIYLFNYRNEMTDTIGNAFSIDFTKKRRTLLEIKKF